MPCAAPPMPHAPPPSPERAHLRRHPAVASHALLHKRAQRGEHGPAAVDELALAEALQAKDLAAAAAGGRVAEVGGGRHGGGWVGGWRPLLERNEKESRRPHHRQPQHLPAITPLHPPVGLQGVGGDLVGHGGEGAQHLAHLVHRRVLVKSIQLQQHRECEQQGSLSSEVGTIASAATRAAQRRRHAQKRCPETLEARPVR